MVNVSIGGMTVEVEKASHGWINQMINEARKYRMQICVQVSINVPGAAVGLATPGCGGGGGGGRAPNEKERRIIDAWNKRGFGAGNVSPGDLQAFLQELARLT